MKITMTNLKKLIREEAERLHKIKKLQERKGEIEEQIRQLSEDGVIDEKLDPVGHEDDDVDNDGKVDSTDSYLMNRRKKIKKSIEAKDKEGKK